jgi:hypothetical protein
MSITATIRNKSLKMKFFIRLGCFAALLFAQAVYAQKTGIGTLSPTATLHVQNTASTAVRVVDGTQGVNKRLTSDASGNASWLGLQLKAIPGTLTSTIRTFTSYGTNQKDSLYTGSSITLPPGKWMVSMGTTVGFGSDINIIGSDGSLWCKLYLSDVPTGTGPITADLLAAITGPRVTGVTMGRGMCKNFLKGQTAIFNNTTANKTYYVWARQEQFGTTTLSSGSGNAYWTGIFGPGYWERYFYALPIK